MGKREQVEEIVRQMLISKFSMWNITKKEIDAFIEKYTTQIMRVAEEKDE